MIGSLVGAGLSAVGSIFGGLKASEAMKKVKNNLTAQKAENLNWYNQRYNEDATQRADAQAILTRTEEAIKARNRDAAGIQSVMGGTDESVAATKAANADALAEAATQIAINGEKRKDSIEEQYQQKNAQFNEALNKLEIGKAKAISEAIKGVTSVGSDIASSF